MARRSTAPDAFLMACPSRHVMARLGEKWTMLVLVALAERPLRFGELRRRVEGVSQKMLSQTLRNLERDGLATRRVFDGRPLRVEYGLTRRGRSLEPVVRAIKRWSERHLHAIGASARKYESKAERG